MFFPCHQESDQESFSLETPMELEEIAASIFLYTYIKSRKQRKKKRRFWVHPLLQDRSSKGIFCLLFNDLRKHEEKFFNFTRMSIASFDEPVLHLKDGLRGMDTNMRDSISPEEKLLVTLR